MKFAAIYVLLWGLVSDVETPTGAYRSHPVTGAAVFSQAFPLPLGATRALPQRMQARAAARRDPADAGAARPSRASARRRLSHRAKAIEAPRSAGT
jgi:hypothetical protein